MFDEQIKSRLAKDLKYHRENLEKNAEIYNYDRANAFNREIKKLGLVNGESYLDLFRKLITSVGNSMGYVRMLRSGGLNACSNASVFLPTLDEDMMFVSLSKENGLKEVTVKAAENLEHDIQNLSRNFAEGTKYFKLLVNQFVPYFQNPKHTHLKNFYIIVPPLTINFIEHILTSKDKLNKKDKNGALFTDDGFAMGLIYVLKLLNQISDFNSLNWYKSVKNKIRVERQKIEESRKQTGYYNDEKLSQTLLLSEKRLSLFQQEFELLFFNINSAKIFFND
jgi:WASH complex subunit 7